MKEIALVADRRHNAHCSPLVGGSAYVILVSYFRVSWGCNPGLSTRYAQSNTGYTTFERLSSACSGKLISLPAEEVSDIATWTRHSTRTVGLGTIMPRTLPLVKLPNHGGVKLRKSLEEFMRVDSGQSSLATTPFAKIDVLYFYISPEGRLFTTLNNPV